MKTRNIILGALAMLWVTGLVLQQNNQFKKTVENLVQKIQDEKPVQEPVPTPIIVQQAAPVPEQVTRFVQAVNEPLVYWYSYSQSGTLTINKSDAIAGVTISVPSNATDTVIYRGGTRTIDGKAVGYGRVPPGSSLGLGYNDLQRLDSVTITIRAHSMPSIILTPVK